MSPPTLTIQTPGRRYDVDALRVLAFALLILYHVAMLYVGEWHFHLKSSYTTDWLQLPMIASNRWRMSLLFILSGIAIGLFAPERAPFRFALSRTWRVFMPLVVGMFTTIPIQAYCQGVTNGLVEPGFWAFMVRYWHVAPFPKDAFDGWEMGVTWNHLWYLAYLWIYTLILVALLPILRSRPAVWLQSLITNRRGFGLLLPGLPLLAYLFLLADRFPQNNALFNDWFSHATYFTVFLFGYWMARNEAFWQELVRCRRALAVAAIVACVAYLSVLAFAREPAPMAVIIFGRTLRATFMWCTLLAILAWGRARLNRPFRWLPYATEAVYPWYILHQTLIVAIAYWVIPLELPVLTEVAIVITGTIGGCALLHEFVIRRIAILRPLFGLKMLPPRTRAPGENVARVPAA